MKVIVTFLMSCIGLALYAQNPIVQTNFTPDPAPMVYNDRVYVYTGDDIAGYDFYYMTKGRVYSSGDMVKRTGYGVSISLESSFWPLDRAWAARRVVLYGQIDWNTCALTGA